MAARTTLNWGRESVRVGIVGLAVALVMAIALAVIPLRTWRAQQLRESELAVQLVAAKSEVARLAAHACRAERVGDVALRAREQFNLVPPDHEVYRVILPAELSEDVADPNTGSCQLGPEPPPTTSTTTTTTTTTTVVTTVVNGVVMMLVPVTTTSVSSASSVSSDSSVSPASTAEAGVVGPGGETVGGQTASLVSIGSSTSVATTVAPTTSGSAAKSMGTRAGGGAIMTSLPTFSTRPTTTISTSASATSITVATILVPYESASSR